MTSISCVNFKGPGSESTGSIAHRNNPTCPTCGNECPTCSGAVSFHGRDSFEKKDGPSALGVIGTIALVTAGVIGGLGYAHKADAFKKLGDGWMKKTIGKLEPAGKKCHEWCTTIKNESTKLWTKVKDKFSSKKG